MWKRLQTVELDLAVDLAFRRWFEHDNK